MRNARSARINVKMLRMNMPKRYLGEWEGEWKCAVAASMSMMSVNRAAIGWTMRIAERVVLAEVGKSKVSDCAEVKSEARIDQHVDLDKCNRSWQAQFTQLYLPVLYPISMELQTLPLQ